MRLKWLFLLLLTVKCTHSVQVKKMAWQSVRKTLLLTDSTNVISIENQSDKSISFYFDLYNQFPIAMHHIQKQVKSFSANENIPYPQSACMYVNKNTFTSPPMSTENWQHAPELFLNSIGGGACDDKASVLAYIWKSMGDSVRIMALEGHVVPEIYHDHQWKMFDPDNGIYYCDQSGKILSVDELEKNPEIIRHPVSCGKPMNPIFGSPTPLVEHYAKIYASVENNMDGTGWQIPSYKQNSKIELPSYSSLRITLNAKKQIVNLVVELNLRSKGNLFIPFVASKATGNFKYAIKDHISSSKHFPLGSRPKLFKITDVTSPSQIFYFVNPKLPALRSSGLLKVKSTGTVKISTGKLDITQDFFSPYCAFFDQKSTRSVAYYNAFHLMKKDQDLMHYMQQEFEVFLQGDSTLNDVQRTKWLSDFKKDFPAWMHHFEENKLPVEKFLREQYPISVCYLFLAYRYNRRNDLEMILRPK